MRSTDAEGIPRRGDGTAGRPVYGEAVAALPGETPRLFEHRLDPSLFAGDRLDWLCREAGRRGLLKVQFADPGRQRHGLDPIYTRPRYPLLEDVLERPIQYR